VVKINRGISVDVGGVKRCDPSSRALYLFWLEVVFCRKEIVFLIYAVGRRWLGATGRQLNYSGWRGSQQAPKHGIFGAGCGLKFLLKSIRLLLRASWSPSQKRVFPNFPSDIRGRIFSSDWHVQNGALESIFGVIFPSRLLLLLSAIFASSSGIPVSE
jgi:hypothetical protein